MQGLFNTETGNKLAATAKKMQSQVVNLWRQDNCFQTLPGQPLFEEEKAEAVAVAVAGAPRQIESPQAGAASSSRYTDLTMSRTLQMAMLRTSMLHFLLCLEGGHLMMLNKGVLRSILVLRKAPYPLDEGITAN